MALALMAVSLMWHQYAFTQCLLGIGRRLKSSGTWASGSDARSVGIWFEFAIESFDRFNFSAVSWVGVAHHASVWQHPVGPATCVGADLVATVLAVEWCPATVVSPTRFSCSLPTQGLLSLLFSRAYTIRCCSLNLGSP